MYWSTLERKFFISFRFTILSIKPCLSRYSAVWKSSGNFCFIVSSITRRPAKPIIVPGSAMFMSPTMAKLAETPPVVGCVRMEMYGIFALLSFAMPAQVFAICMRETMPSCIRAPPEAETIM